MPTMPVDVVPPPVDRSKSVFSLRHHSLLVFDPAVDSEAKGTYFGKDGDRDASRINVIGDLTAVSINVNSSGADAMELPVDDKEARIARVELFEQALEKEWGGERPGGDVSSILMDDERVLMSLPCSEISGLPSTTAPFSFVSGRISVALVESPTSGFRLLFTVSEGSRDITVREHFEEMADQNSCVLCFSNIGKCACCHGFGSSASFEYSALEVQLDQFFTLPLHCSLVDSSCYQSSQNEFSVAGSKNDSQHYGDCCPPCPVCCPPCPTFPVCCALVQQWAYRAIHFTAHEEHKLGSIHNNDKDRVLEEQTSIEDGKGLNFTMSRRSLTEGYVVIHYRNLLDKATHTCKMRVDLPNKESFQESKRFVSLLTGLRDKFAVSTKQASSTQLFTQSGQGLYSPTSWGVPRPPRSAFRYYRPKPSGGFELVVVATVVVGFRDGAEWFDSVASTCISLVEAVASRLCSPRLARQIKTAFEAYLCNACTRPAVDFLGTLAARCVNTVVYSPLHWSLKMLLGTLLSGGILAVLVSIVTPRHVV